MSFSRVWGPAADGGWPLAVLHLTAAWCFVRICGWGISIANCDAPEFRHVAMLPASAGLQLGHWRLRLLRP